MAARKKLAEAASVEDDVRKTPTRDELKQAFIWLAKYTDLVPVGWGPTGSGKTRLAFAISEAFTGKADNHFVLLASQFSADDIAGFQTIVDGQLKQQLPEWFRLLRDKVSAGEKVVVIIDELSIARDDVTGALWTFLRDGHLHGQRLGRRGEDYIVIGATNPGFFPGQLRTRCAFFHVPYDRDYMSSFAEGEFAQWAALHGTTASSDGDPAFSNEPPPAPAVASGSAISALRLNTAFWTLSDQSRRVIVEALLPPVDAEQVWRQMQGQVSGSIAALIHFPDRLYKLLSTTAAADMPKAASLVMATYVELGNMVGKEPDEVIARALAYGPIATLWSNEKFMQYLFDDVADKPEQVFKSIEKLDSISESIQTYLKDSKFLFQKPDGTFDGSILVLGGLEKATADNFLEETRQALDYKPARRPAKQEVAE